MGKILVLYAILIFAKKAPKMIADLLNIKGDNLGLKGLSIKNKMGEAALVGDKVKAGMSQVEGGIKRAAGTGKELLKNKLTGGAGKLMDLAGKTKGGQVLGTAKESWKKGKGNGMERVTGTIRDAYAKGKGSLWGDGGSIRGALKDDASKAKNKISDAAQRKIADTARKGTERYIEGQAKRADMGKVRDAYQNGGMAEAAKEFIRSVERAGERKSDRRLEAFNDKKAQEAIAKGETYTPATSLPPEEKQKQPSVASKIYGSFALGVNETRKTGSSEGQFQAGMVDVNPAYDTISNKITDAIGTWADEARAAAGYADAKGLGNKIDRLALGIQESNDQKSMSKLKIDDAGFFEQFRNVVDDSGRNIIHEDPNRPGHYLLDADAADAYTKTDAFKAHPPSYQETFKKVMIQEQLDQAVAFKSASDRLTELGRSTDGYTFTQQPDGTYHVTDSSGNAVDPTRAAMMSRDYEEMMRLNTSIESFMQQNHKYSGQTVDRSNVDNYITKLQEDKASNDAKIKERTSKKPKNEKK